MPETMMVNLAHTNRDGLKQVLVSLRGFIFSIAHTINSALAEDCMQEAELIILSRFERFRGQTDSELKGWVRVIVCNCCFAAIRKQKREIPIESELPENRPRRSASREVRMDEERESLVELLGTLTDDERSAVLLRHCENWSIQQIAEELGRTPSAIGGLLRRSMAKLRSQTTLSQWSQLMDIS